LNTGQQSEPNEHQVSIRVAERGDIPFILQMVRELAVYESALDKVKATEALLEKWLFEECKAECLIASLDGVDRGFALFYTSFSTWEGLPGIYLEDLFVQEAVRGHGLGLALIKELVRITLERGYPRLEWSCLDWNKPSLAFYESLGAIAHPEWISHRMELDAMQALIAV